jgi:hypothetical protein
MRENKSIHVDASNQCYESIFLTRQTDAFNDIVSEKTSDDMDNLPGSKLDGINGYISVFYLLFY